MDARIKNKVIFCDPNRLNEIIMREGKNFDLPTLSTFLIDSFCKGFVQCHQAYTSIEPFKNISRTEFLATLNDMKSELFSLPEYVVDYAINDCQKKNKVLTSVEKGQHAIIDKSSSPQSLR